MENFQVYRDIQAVIEIAVAAQEEFGIRDSAIFLVVDILMEKMGKCLVLIVFGSVVAGKNDIVVRSQIILIDSQRP